MQTCCSRIRREIEHYRAMPETARVLTISYFLRSIAYPLLTIFTGAYIWNINNDVILLVLYYIGNFSVVPLMFVFNKWLLRGIRLNTLYAIGTVLTGISSLMVVFFKETTPEMYILYGIFYGLGNGIYWANRNFLSLRYTSSTIRGYFTGLQFSLSTLSTVIVPAIAGWVIVFSDFGYELLVITAFAILLFAGLIIRNVSFEQPAVSETNTRPFSPVWHKVRILSIAIGCVDSAIYILPTILILTTMGSEGILGVVSSVVAVLTAIACYIFGRKYRQSTYLPIFTGMLAASAVAGLPLLWGITPLAVAWYLLVANLSDSIIWIANEPVIMGLQDDEAKRMYHTHYQLIVDREWFVNIGRVGALSLFLAIALADQTLALRVIASISGIAALGTTLFTRDNAINKRK